MLKTCRELTIKRLGLQIRDVKGGHPIVLSDLLVMGEEKLAGWGLAVLKVLPENKSLSQRTIQGKDGDLHSAVDS